MKWIASITLLCLLACAGCQSQQAGPIWRLAPAPQSAHAGNVYLLRGFLGIWSYGIDDIGKEIAGYDVRCALYSDPSWDEAANAIIAHYYDGSPREPIVIVGHSYGADDAINIARELDKAKVPVDLVVTIDPVTPPRVPKNVRHLCNLYQSNLLDALPAFRGLPVEAERDFNGQLDNFNLHGNRKDLCDSNTNHFNICDKPKVHEAVRELVLSVCVSRDQWAQANSRTVER